MSDIGANVTRQRKARGLTQSALARAAGLTPSAVWQIEHGTRQPVAETLRKLAVALEVSTDQLLGMGTEPAVTAPACDRCGKSGEGMNMGEAICAGWWFTPPTSQPDAPDAYCPECTRFLFWAVMTELAESFR